MAEEEGKVDEAKEEAKTSEPREPSDELKVVIVLKGDRSLVGIQSPDCDPIFTTIEGGLTAVRAQLPALIKSANAQWDANPKNPKADLPEPEPAPAAARGQSTQKPKKADQPSFF
ncbi:hypothetical protein ES703_50529 [subsurface metagenome]